MPLSGPFARIRALIALAGDAPSRESFARTFEAALATKVLPLESLDAGEADLASLDDGAWQHFKAGAAERLMRAPKRGWDPLFDLLNEAKGYAYLQSLGCMEIAFVARTYAGKSPDLMAALNGRRVLCEVKTVSVAETLLSDEFLSGKLAWTLAEAKAQMEEFGPRDARMIVTLVFRRATGAPMSAASREQIEALAASTGVEVAVF